MVNSRFLAGGISDWFATIREMYRVIVATGTGWIQITELRPRLRCDDNSLPANAASATWSNIFTSNGPIGEALGTTNWEEIGPMLKRRVEAAGFVDVVEHIDKAPVGGWHPGITPSGIELYSECFRPAIESHREVYGARVVGLS
jgi:hypothetical protein